MLEFIEWVGFCRDLGAYLVESVIVDEIGSVTMDESTSDGTFQPHQEATWSGQYTNNASPSDQLVVKSKTSTSL